MSFIVGRKSLGNLVGVHPLMAACAYKVISEELKLHDATIFDGVRHVKTQRYYLSLGRSKTMNSDHLPGRAALY